MQYQIATLSGGELGMTGLDSTVVTLDATAAGYGWFVDPTPADNSEFTVRIGASEEDALPGSPAYGRMDLLTVVEHELGNHAIGLDDIDPQAAVHYLMTETLGTGVRRLTERAISP